MSHVPISEATKHLRMALCFSLALGNLPSFTSVQAMNIFLGWMVVGPKDGWEVTRQAFYSELVKLFQADLSLC